MKVIERLRWLADSTDEVDAHAFDMAVMKLGRSLLAVVEAQEREIAAWRAVHAASCNASRIGKIHGGRGALLEEAMKDAHACVAVAKDAMKSTGAALRALEGGA